MVKKTEKIKQKSLCKLCKNDCLKERFEVYLELIQDSRYVCKKCGRTAHSKKNLCKPLDIYK